jgi:hypothetical protein
MKDALASFALFLQRLAMSKRTPSSTRKSKEISVPVAIAVAVIVLLICCFVGYRYLNQPRVPVRVYIDTARYWIEKPERDKLSQQGLAKAQIDDRIQGMWDNGTLKLPPGEPGVDWAGTPTGIIMIPKSAADLGKMDPGPVPQKNRPSATSPGSSGP